MKWKQFFTPVNSINSSEAKKLSADFPDGDVVFLDVRQPKEYEASHIPGAKLIPIKELESRVSELDPAKPTIVYCAIGGRSRVAAQILAGKEFKKVYNLNGGIKAWKNEIAIGPQDMGLELFSGQESAEESIAVGFGLEEGLREFYLTMKTKVAGEAVKSLFEKLADIEILHQKRLVELYRHVTGIEVTIEDFIEKTVQPAMEGGLTTEEYLQMYQPNLESEQDIISLALAIEAQAMDLYQRAADHALSPKVSEVMQQIANEEHTHIARLTDYFDTILETC